jgi:outer membrane protein assembly factor BamB
MGVIYDYESPNQHGAIPYLWDTGGTSRIYDPFTGEWLYTIENVPSGTAAVGPNGERLIYQFNYAQRWLAMWNMSDVEDLWGAETGTSGWQWRPVGKTVNGTAGYAWNVTLPDLPGQQTGRAGPAIRAVLDDRIIGTTGLMSFQYGTENCSVWCLSLKPGQEGTLMWKWGPIEPPVPGGTMIWGTADLESKVFVMRIKETMQLYGYDLDTGNLLWNTEPFGPWAMYGMGTKICDGVLYVSTRYGGQIFAFDARTGTQSWEWTDDACGLEGPYERWPLSGTPLIADGKIYVTTGEHSHTQPLYRGWSMYCVDATTGVGLWNMTGVWGSPLLADGYLVSLNGMDNQIYCFGKGQTATTVETPLTAVPLGSSVIIQGTVTDQSPGAKDTPAIADTDMTAWMNYLYKQHAMPMVTGVPVTLDAIDPNGNFVHITTVTSDMSGLYSYMWAPEKEGKYTIIATFEGSDSYFSSYAETALGVGPASAPTQPIEPEEPTAEAPFITTEIAIIAAVIIAVAVIVGFWIIRKRK